MNVTLSPNEEGFGLNDTDVVVAFWSTWWSSGVDVLAACVALPSNAAVIEWLPAPRVEMEIAATANASSDAEPITSIPSRNVTVPSVGALPAGAATTAV